MTTPWNPPGTPYPPAQDGATLLVWDPIGERPQAPREFRNFDGEWRRYFGHDEEFDAPIWGRPSLGCPWLLIPDPEQGEAGGDA